MKRVITTQILSDSNLDSLLHSISTYLVSQGLTSVVHSRELLDYRPKPPKKRGIFSFPSLGSKSKRVVIEITEIPSGLTSDAGVSIGLGLAFEVTTPAPIFQSLASLLAPYAVEIEQLQTNTGRLIVGRTYNATVSGATCDYCGHTQKVTIQFSLTEIVGGKGYAPGGNTVVICSNSACGKRFPIYWCKIEIDMPPGPVETPARIPPHDSSRSPLKSRTPPKRKPAVWLPYGESASIQGYDIPDGLIYVGSSLPEVNGYLNDACLIDPTLKVSPQGLRGVDDTMGYWPRYSGISAVCRGKYLEWLAGCRNNPQIELGCVFLFFYGLERRLLVDGLNGNVPAEERTQIVDEVRRLRNLYRESNSFQNYSSAFLAMEWALYRRDEPLPDYLRRSDRVGMAAFRIMLAQCASREEPLPESMALQWLSLRPDYYKLRTPAHRCKSDFEELFAIRYKEKFGEGLIVKPGTKMLERIYSAASPSVRLPNDLRVGNLHDPFELNGALKRIKDVVESCTVELEPYSRLLGRSQAQQSSLAIAASLPAPLKTGMPEVERLNDYLVEVCKDGVAMVCVKNLYEIWGERSPVSFGKKESEYVAALIEGAGFGIAPHSRYHNMMIAIDGSVVVFPGGHGKDFQPSEEFSIMVLIVRLGSLVAQADEDHSEAEEAALQRLIDGNKKLSKVERQSLSAFLFWSLRTPQTTVGLKKDLAEVDETGKTAIGRILIAVANADGRIDLRELGQLERLYLSLGLAREQVASDIHSVAAGSEPVTVGLREQAPAYAIPSPETAPEQGFVPNIELLEKTKEETRKVRVILAPILSSQDEAEVATELPTEEEMAVPLAELDGPYRELLQRLLMEPTWEQPALEAVCTELGLLPDGAMEVLNEWAFKNAEAPLIDYGEPVYIDIELARGIMNV